MITVRKHTSPKCGFCKKWDKEEKQYLNPSYEFEEIVGGAARLPTFVIIVNDETITLVGYKTIGEIEQAIEKLRNVPD